MLKINSSFLLAFYLNIFCLSLALASPSNHEARETQKTNLDFLVIKDPEVLKILETLGLALSDRLLMPGLKTQGSTNNQNLYEQKGAYFSLANVITSDLQELILEERSYRGVGAVGVGMRYPIRIFDEKWLRSKIAKFELVGVTNRVDQVALYPNTCGEFRLIYRLSYFEPRTKTYSRLPMTLMLRSSLPGNVQSIMEWHRCKDLYLGSWTYPHPNLNAQQKAQWLVSEQGPLHGYLTGVYTLSSVEINLQALRIPSTMRPELGGHASYLMRSFEAGSENKKLVLFEMPLENTPNVEKIKQSPEMKAQFLNWLNQRPNLNRLDAGLLSIPDEIGPFKGYLARRAYSYSPMGLNRFDNRLFHQILSEKDFTDYPFEKNSFVKSRSAAIERLNDLTCIGCHQGRATAGFHYLGVDALNTHAFNALQFEGSGHFHLELKRRGGNVCPRN